MKSLFFISIVLLFLTNISAQGTEKVKEEVWQKELQYWQYVKNNDTAGYRTLWHDNFIGYPETERITGKDKISNWITDAYNTKGRHYEFLLDKLLRQLVINVNRIPSQSISLETVRFYLNYFELNKGLYISNSDHRFCTASA